MPSRLHKIFTGAAVLSIGFTACIASAPAALAGSMPLNGVFGWGENATGSLGTGSTAITKTPSLAASGIKNVTTVATSSTHTLFLDREGNVYAAGDNSRGQLGNGLTANSTTPVKVKLPLRFGVPDYATQVWASEGVSFMLGSYGDLYSWGSNDKGLTGLGKTSGNTLTPLKVPNITLGGDSKDQLSISSTAVAVVSGHEDKWEGTSQLHTWGSNANGVLGRPDVSLPIVSTPQRVLIPDPEEEEKKWVDKCSIVGGHEECDSVEVLKTYDELIGLSPELVAVGKNFFVVVAGGGKIHTWGVNTKGQLGMNLAQTKILTQPTTSAALYLESQSSVSSIAAGEEHVILLGDDGLVYGWGDNSKSQVAPYYAGSNSTTFLNVLQRLTIKKEVADSSSWDYVQAGDDTSYAVTSDNTAYGWGDNSTGEIANTKEAIIKTPERITFPHETEISSFVAGGNNAVAVSDYVVEYTDIYIPEGSDTLPKVSAHGNYSQTLKSSGGYPNSKHVWTMYELPPGLKYDSQTGRIYGQPTKIGTYYVEATVTDNVDQVSKNFTLEVSKASPAVGVTYSNVSPGVTRANINVASNGVSASGTASLKYGTTTKNVALVNGKATVDITGVPGTKVNASVKYNGSGTMNASSSNVSAVTVTPKYNPTVTTSYKSSNPGQITATVKVTRGTVLATGAVTLNYGTAKKTVNLVNGAATITVAANAGAKYTVSTSYAGTASIAASTTPVTSITTMKKHASTVVTSYKSSNPGQITATIKVSSGTTKGTGAVTLNYGTAKKAVNLVNGAATITVAANAGAKYTVSTSYAGTTSLAASTSKATSITTMKKRTATVGSVYTSSKPGQLTATVTVKDGKALGTGTVTFYVGTVKKAATLSNGKAVITIATTAGKKHSVKTVYGGNINLNAQTSATKSVTAKAKYSSKPSVTYSVKGRTVTATITAKAVGGLTPSGTVYLYDGTKKIKTLKFVKGVVKVPFSTTAGTHKFKAVYAGDTYFNSYTSNVSSVKVK